MLNINRSFISMISLRSSVNRYKTTGKLFEQKNVRKFASGISFDLNEKQQKLKDVVQNFTKEIIIPNAAEWDKNNEFPIEAHQKAHDLGFFSASIPLEYGGLGLNLLDLCIINEELSYGCSGFSNSIIANGLALGPLQMYGSHELKKKYMGRIANEGMIAAYAVTEPRFGSNITGETTRAHKTEWGDYILNGKKMWITNAEQCDWLFVLARTNSDIKAPASKSFTGFIVDRNTPGITLGRKEINMGQRAADTRTVFFEDVRVPKENMVGEENKGFQIAMSAFDMSRPIFACGAVGLAQRCLDESTKYALEHYAFDHSITIFQTVQLMIADMAIGVESARLTYQRAAWEIDQGRHNTYYASVSKCYAADVANKAAADAVQIFGGAGFNSDYPVEKLMRDAKIFQIYEGIA